MSYSIIYETKFIKLKDGRLLHLDRSGCNNDTAGRSRDEFTGKIYTLEELEKRIKELEEMCNGDLTLKIGNKFSTYSDLAKHLLRMSKRSKTFDEFKEERTLIASKYYGILLLKPEEKRMTMEEFNEVFYELLYSGKGLSYRRLRTTLLTEDDIIKALENEEIVEFYVGRKSRKKSYV